MGYIRRLRYKERYLETGNRIYMEPHIDSGSQIIYNAKKSHNIFMETLNLNSKVHVSSDTKGLNDKDNPI